MKTTTTTAIFENEISIKNMIKKVKEEGVLNLLTNGTGVSCYALFNIPTLNIAR